MFLQTHKNTFFLTFLTLLVFLAACAAPAPTNSPAPTQTSAGADGTPAPAETAPPASDTVAPAPASASPTPQPPRVLVIGTLPAEAQTTLTELAAADGFTVQTQLTLLPTDLTAETRLVILAQPPEDLPALLAAAPQTTFWGVNTPASITAPNLVHLQLDATSAQRGFFAGYTAAILTEDWRIGALVFDDVQGQALRSGFVNGGKYFCGLCRSMYPPFAAYPLYVEIPFGSTDEARIAAANLLLEQGVTTVFLGTGITTEALVNHLSAAEIVILGSESPGIYTYPFWAATIQVKSGIVIEAMWQAWQSGEPLAPPPALTLTDINSDRFSPGKQQRALAILPDLLAGYLQTEPVP